jgi:hypothetical protein
MSFRDSGVVGKSLLKRRVVRLGRQNDGSTIVFGPDVAFVEEQGQLRLLKCNETDYAWIPGSLSELLVPNIPDKDVCNISEVIKLFPEDSVHAFCLAAGE